MEVSDNEHEDYLVDIAFKCSPNPGTAAYAIGIYGPGSDEPKIVSKVFPRSTNAEVAALAVIGAFETLPPSATGTIRHRDKTTIATITDHLSRWEANGFRDARGKPVANADVWMRLAGWLKMFPGISFEWADRETGSLATLGKEAERLLEMEKRKAQ